jgi:2-oxo-4-hydroxy-4-carboxy-5-ureidoimidazoline decarboxylase
MKKLSLAAINALDPGEFVAALGWVFEGSPWVAERAYAARPFASVEALHRAMTGAVEAASPAEQLALIRAHPDLATRATTAARVQLGPASTSEQAGVGLDRLSAEEYERFHDLNRRYREQFGFPFVIAVRQHTRASILEAFQRRLQNPVEDEIATALLEIGQITRFRLQDAIG